MSHLIVRYEKAIELFEFDVNGKSHLNKAIFKKNRNIYGFCGHNCSYLIGNSLDDWRQLHSSIYQLNSAK